MARRRFFLSGERHVFLEITVLVNICQPFFCYSFLTTPSRRETQFHTEKFSNSLFILIISKGNRFGDPPQVGPYRGIILPAYSRVVPLGNTVPYNTLRRTVQYAVPYGR